MRIVLWTSKEVYEPSHDPVVIGLVSCMVQMRQIELKVTYSSGVPEPVTLQEAQLSPSDRAMRLVSSNLASCHATVQKLLIRQVLTKLMV